VKRLKRGRHERITAYKEDIGRPFFHHRSSLCDGSLRFKFSAPYYGFLEEVASLGVAGHFTRGQEAMGLFAPKHYMKQFHPKYVSKDELDKKIADNQSVVYYFS